MLATWSRAVQTPGTCRCISCISNTSAVARRTGPGSIRSAWVLGSPTSTFVYTTVFVAGLAIDARAKRDRNEQWETAFSHLREEMSQPTASNTTKKIDVHSIIESLGSAGLVSMEDLSLDATAWDAVHRTAGTELIDDEVFKTRQIEVEINDIPESSWELLTFDSRFPGAPVPEWPANTGPELVRHYLPPQSLWSPEHMRWTALRRRQTWKKLAIQELSISLLVHRLIQHAGVSRLSESDLASLSPQIQSVVRLVKWEPELHRSAQREIRENIRKLSALAVEASPEEITRARVTVNGIAVPQYMQDTDGDFFHICAQMNTAVRNVFKGDRKGLKDADQIALATAKLCHNLLVSSAAPDLQTFNLLISGFKVWERKELVDDVIIALDYCKIRPNEITCAAILDHYVQNDQPVQFSKFVARMRGVDNALMLANPNITINEKGQGRLVRISDQKVYQKIHPTPKVFNALLLGALRFAGFERALDIYYEMKEDGWGLDVVGLSQFLDDCIHHTNWHGGLLIWAEINSIKQQVKPMHMTKAYSQMLSLCSITGNTAAFNQILNEVVRRGLDRKTILNAATKAMHDARWKKEPGLGPAWTADNMLIAMSEYIQDSKAPESRSERDRPPLSEEVNTLGHKVDSSRSPLLKNETFQAQKPVPKDPEEAWAAWLEHELGEPIVSPTQKGEAVEAHRDDGTTESGTNENH